MIQLVLFSVLSAACPSAPIDGSVVDDARRLLEQAEQLQDRGTLQALHLEVHNESDLTLPTISLSYFERHDERAALVFESPSPISGLVVAISKKKDFLVKLPGLRHVQALRLAGRGRKFLGTEFRLTDVLDVHLSQRYVACRSTEVETGTQLVLRPKASTLSNEEQYLEVIINRGSGLIESLTYLDSHGQMVRRQERREIMTEANGRQYYSKVIMHNFETGKRSVIRVTRIAVVNGLSGTLSDRRWIAQVSLWGAK